MTQTGRRHRLEGLEADNLLAFLALLGLLRALETARPAWRPRAAWGLDSPPLRPELVLAEPQATVAICEAAAEGAAELAKDYDFAGRAKPDYAPEEARSILLALVAGRENDTKRRLDLWSSIISEAAVRIDSKSKEERVEATPLCLLGTGNTAFLKTLALEARREMPPPVGKGSSRRQLTGADSLWATLFAPWTRSDDTGSFRWDYADDRRHALRWKAPTADDTIATQHGANRLALIALPLLPCVPVLERAIVRAQLCGGSWDRGTFSFAWPIWRDPASLDGIRAILSHPRLREPRALGHFGVEQVRLAQRIRPTDYFAMTPGQPIE